MQIKIGGKLFLFCLSCFRVRVVFFHAGMSKWTGRKQTRKRKMMVMNRNCMFLYSSLATAWSGSWWLWINKLDCLYFGKLNNLNLLHVQRKVIVHIA